MTQIRIKNMVCNRCIMAVSNLLIAESIPFQHIELGKVILSKKLNNTDFENIALQLDKLGFELISDSKSELIEKIKNEILKYLNQEIETEQVLNLSQHLSKTLDTDYKTLSNNFSKFAGQNISQFYAKLKIEKVKEFISYDQLSFSQIADKFGYSSSAHFTKQFKNITGQTPKEFKNNVSIRKSLDNI